MSSETTPEKKSDSAENKSDNPIKQFNNLNQLTKVLQSFVEQLAQLIVTKNWVSLLLLLDAGLILFCFPGGILAKLLKSIFNFELPKGYPFFFWALVGGIFLTALVIAIQNYSKKTADPA